MNASPPSSHVAVVVMGDVGRSPRMQYHATSLAAMPGMQVHLVGFRGERCFAAVEDAPNIQQHLLGNPFHRWPRALLLVYAPLKVTLQFLQLLWLLLFAMPRQRAVLVQAPPSVPALLAVAIACRIRGARMVIDWHNLGFSVLAATAGPKHVLVRLYEAFERTLARHADAHLCVTNAMRLWLIAHWRVRATVLYDRPQPSTAPSDVLTRHDLYSRLKELSPPLIGGAAADAASASGVRSPSRAMGSALLVDGASEGRKRPARRRGSSDAVSPLARAALQPPFVDPRATSSTLATEVDGAGRVSLRPGRPALIVSSTSWTPDEDFTLLLDALVILDAVASSPRRRSQFPDFLVVITGKGPGRAAFEAAAARLPLTRTTIRTAWLAPSDYPLLLGAADVGISLHTSTSGLDLPMKVLDMFGGGLPVAAVDFACLPELVRHDVNGLIFRTPRELAGQLEALFDGFPVGEPSTATLHRLRAGVAEGINPRWDENWRVHAEPLFAALREGGGSAGARGGGRTRSRSGSSATSAAVGGGRAPLR